MRSSTSLAEINLFSSLNRTRFCWHPTTFVRFGGALGLVLCGDDMVSPSIIPGGPHESAPPFDRPEHCACHRLRRLDCRIHFVGRSDAHRRRASHAADL